jgi:hypothetical protein
MLPNLLHTLAADFYVGLYPIDVGILNGAIAKRAGADVARGA